MHENNKQRHTQLLPSSRKIRRTCNKELYRTIKKLKIWIPPDLLEQAEELYYKRVVLHLPWIIDHGSNRKALADWWVEQIAPDIAKLWNIDQDALSNAFRDSFGG